MAAVDDLTELVEHAAAAERAVLASKWKDRMSSLAMWLLLTVLATALAQQPKVRRRLLREIADYSVNAEAKAYARETAQALGTGQFSGSAERVGGRST